MNDAVKAHFRRFQGRACTQTSCMHADVTRFFELQLDQRTAEIAA